MERPTSTASSSVAALTTSMRMSLDGALGVADELPGEVGADASRTASANSSCAGGDPGGAGGEQQHGVVGGHAAVGVDPVEGGAGGGAQRRVERRRLSTSASVVRTTSMVARPGASMPAPLAMPPTVQPSPLGDGRLVHGVGGLDGDGGLLAAVLGRAAAAAFSMPGSSLSIGQQQADQPGGGDGDLARAVSAEDLGGLLGGGVGVLEALRAGAGVGAAGVEDDGGDLAALEDLLGPEDGGGLDAVGGEDARGGAAGPVVDHEGQVRVAALLDPGGDARRRESLAAVTLTALLFASALHPSQPAAARSRATPIVESPVSSGSPRAMFMLCTAPPAVPLVRLSMALIAMIRPAASS